MAQRVKAAASKAGEGSRAEYAGTLEGAMAMVKGWASELEKVEAVVLSPASASWDQFPNYEVRGERFAALAREG
jgi:UDP-N-acetylmuramoylalanine--D-glutamate ligase